MHVPDGWEQKKLGSVAELQRGFDLPSSKRIKGCVPVISSGGVSGFHDEAKVKAPGIVTGRYGSIGDVFFIEVDFWPLNTALWVKDFHGNDPKYLYYLLNKIDYKKFSDKTGVPGINRNDLHAIKMPVPPPPEQHRIAQILTTWDKAIEKLKCLITAKQKRKKALMQQLLTGKKRFAGFDGEFMEYRLEQLCLFKRGKGLSKEKLSSEGQYKCILYGELYTKYGEVITNVLSRTNDTDSIKSVSGDILIPSSTTTSGIDLANATALLEDDVLLGGDINILRPDISKVCSEFLSYLLTHIKKHQLASRAQGITIIHLYGSDLKPLLVKLPDIKEQQKIAAILFVADKEIESHQTQFSALKQQKKGLMQQLLTGKRRVQLEKEAENVSV
ncbi:restriction endonuclease subunit S [Nitrosomonas sp.]|uniref:restriction endonuclease subunit S n=1 Tax=Nitrosomonas sp. TaxID=42353 RepID=UPI0025EF9FF1|nr:restriction endonuclease subunit S [Nitrosomonas sp.]